MLKIAGFFTGKQQITLSKMTPIQRASCELCASCNIAMHHALLSPEKRQDTCVQILDLSIL